MNCRFCGAKLGLMERWRYGDFCSQEHKSDFSNETQRLAQERLMSMRRPAKPAGTNTLFVDEPAIPEPLEEPAPVGTPSGVEPVEGREIVLTGAAEGAAPAQDPEIQEFVTHCVIAPVPPAPALPPPEPPSAKPGKRDWKYLAKVAEFDLLPVMINTGSSRLFRTMEVANRWEDSTFSLAAFRLVFVPEPFQPEMRAAKAQMPSAELRPREAFQSQSWASVPDPVTIPRTTWVDETGRRWVYSMRQPGPGDYPAIGEVLEEYPLTAPWTNWPDWMLDEGKGTWAPAGSARQAQREPAPAVGAPPSATRPAAPPTAAPQEFKLAPLAPAAPSPRSGRGPSSANRAGTAGPAGVGAGERQEGRTQEQGSGDPGSTSSAGTGQGGTTATGKSAGGPGGSALHEDAAVGGGNSGGSGGSGSTGGSGGSSGSGNQRGAGPASRRGQTGRWQPIVPPIFHALIDIAHDMTPHPGESAVYGFALWPIRPRDCQPSQPGAGLGVTARLTPRDTAQQRLSIGSPAGGDPPPASLDCDSASWPRPNLSLPRFHSPAGKPGLPPRPRHVALRLPLLDRWTPQTSEPAMFLGANARW